MAAMDCTSLVTLTILLATAISTAYVVRGGGLGAGCAPLLYRDGVRVNCISTQNSPTPIDCHHPAQRIPVGTVATYGCDEPYYFPAHRGPDSVRQRTLTCNKKDGQWAGGLSRFHLYSCVLNCGVTNLGRITTFILNGTVVDQADWPWHATIFKRESASSSGGADKYDYSCGGSLIKPRGAKEFFVVTAAHCMSLHGRRRDTDVKADDILVALGAAEARVEGMQAHSPEAQLFHVSQVLLHEAYNGGRSLYQADIALLRLKEPVRFQNNVLPICLGEAEEAPGVGHVGHISGFGLFDRDVFIHSNVLRTASFPVVDSDKCSVWRPLRKLNAQEYCAGTDNRQNACNGDSGGGMVFNGTDEYGRSRYYLHGIVSHGRGRSEEETACDTYTVYTKVSAYMDWIYGTVDQFDEGEGRGGDTSSGGTVHFGSGESGADASGSSKSCPDSGGTSNGVTTTTTARTTLCVPPDPGNGQGNGTWGTCPKGHKLFCRIVVYLPNPDPCDGGERCCVASA